MRDAKTIVLTARVPLPSFGRLLVGCSGDVLLVGVPRPGQPFVVSAETAGRLVRENLADYGEEFEVEDGEGFDDTGESLNGREEPS